MNRRMASKQSAADHSGDIASLDHRGIPDKAMLLTAMSPERPLQDRLFPFCQWGKPDVIQADKLEGLRGGIRTDDFEDHPMLSGREFPAAQREDTRRNDIGEIVQIESGPQALAHLIQPRFDLN